MKKETEIKQLKDIGVSICQICGGAYCVACGLICDCEDDK